MDSIPDLFRFSIVVSWSLIMVGFISGAVIGLNFHKSDWLGGYGSFSRRILRLGHISCFGLPILNTLLILLFLNLKVDSTQVTGSQVLWMAGQISMPAICFATAAFMPARHLFFIPVASLILGTGLLIGILHG